MVAPEVATDANLVGDLLREDINLPDIDGVEVTR